MTTKEIADFLVAGLNSVIKGKQPQIEIFIASFLSGGHVLIEDFPGLGKTTLAKSLAHLVGREKNGNTSAIFKRIQFTPDLLPYDITGVDIFNPEKHLFEFLPGPVFCDILLADEINRTTPKVQSALLEAMAEKQITSSGITRPINSNFFVVATQNPIDSEGTYPLPAAQLDRFMIRLSLGYPDAAAEADILHQNPGESIFPSLIPVININDISISKFEQTNVFCHPALESAILSIVRATRTHPQFQLGVSPRGALQFLHLARTFALIKGRSWVVDQDIIDLSIHVLAHRIIPKSINTDISAILQILSTDTLNKVGKKVDWAKGFLPNDTN